jgi:type VI secretion system protein
MSLLLKVTSYKGMPPAETLTARFDEEGGMIGRAPDNDLVLPDPEKLISRKHASIRFENGRYVFIDNSTSGTYSGHQNALLHHDSISLRDGDRLKIGDYELRVEITDEPRGGSSPFFSDRPEPQPRNPATRDFSTVGDPDLDPSIAAPFEKSQRSAPGTPSFIDQADTPPFHESFVPPEAPTPSELAEFNVEELLRDFDTPALASSSIDQPPPFSANVRASDLVSASPRASKSGGKGQSLMGDRRDERVDEVPASDSEAACTEDEAPPADPAPPTPNPASPLKEAALKELWAVNAAAANVALFRLFLKGAGIKDLDLVSAEELPGVMQSLGTLFRDLVDGVMTVLRARSELKSQFRVMVTTMRPANNNPLKFTANVEDAMKIMLARDHPGFIDPVEAVREGFSDIMNHQLALTAGMQASLAELLKRFEPQTFERPFEEGIVFQKKAKCWDAYSKAYASLVSEALDDFFGDAFAEVYEQQMNVLRPTRYKN